MASDLSSLRALAVALAANPAWVHSVLRLLDHAEPAPAREEPEIEAAPIRRMSGSQPRLI